MGLFIENSVCLNSMMFQIIELKLLQQFFLNFEAIITEVHIY